MKNNIANVVGILLLAVATSFPQSAPTHGVGRLTGAWNLVTTPRVCATGQAITSFQATYIFSPGGTFSGLSSGTGSGGRGREQLGVWKHLEGRNYRFRFKTFLFNASGVATGYQILTQNVELGNNGQSWSSSGISQTFNFDGIETATGCSTIVAERVADL